jgi:hypothetical protein
VVVVTVAVVAVAVVVVVTVAVTVVVVVAVDVTFASQTKPWLSKQLLSFHWNPVEKTVQSFAPSASAGSAFSQLENLAELV